MGGLKAHENRMLGQLYKVGAKSGGDNECSITVMRGIKSFSRNRPMTLVRLPAQYNVASNTSRYAKKTSDIAMEWMSLLSLGSGTNQFLERLVVSIMSENPDIASECVGAYQTKYKRMTPEATAALQEMVRMSDTQMENLARAIFHYTGIRIFAPKGKMA